MGIEQAGDIWPAPGLYQPILQPFIPFQLPSLNWDTSEKLNEYIDLLKQEQKVRIKIAKLEYARLKRLEDNEKVVE